MARQSNAWGHSLEVPASDKTAMGRSMGRCASGLRCPNKVWKDDVILSPITGKPYNPHGGYWVGGPAVLVGYYKYITGRAMRTTWRELPMCLDCATKFAAKHGLTVPEIPSRKSSGFTENAKQIADALNEGENHYRQTVLGQGPLPGYPRLNSDGTPAD